MHRALLDLTLDLHQQLPAAGNLAWSPYSAVTALGLAAAGARGRTYRELAQLFRHPGNQPEELAETSRALADSTDPRGADLAAANTLWIRSNWRPRSDYLRTGQDWAGTVVTADFPGDPAGARAAINADVARTTRGLVRQVLPAGAIHPQVAAVLVTALYLRTAWRNAFARADTVPRAFHSPSQVRQVATMHQQERLGYAASGGWQMVTLPTAGDVVVDLLLADGDRRLTADILVALHRASVLTKVDLRLPRFRIESSAVLAGPLRALGVTAAFDPAQADFTGIAKRERIWLDTVAHQCVLQVDELGLTGAAATAAVLRTISMDLSRPVPFHVDRPFLVLVRHQRTGVSYFLARVVDPTG